MAKVFISYRRADSVSETGRIYDRLVARFGRKNVFKDVDDIPAGANFADYIQDSLAASAVTIIVIGPRWLDLRDDTGRRRIESPGDYVRLEVETALRLGLPIIPVLIEGARMPGAGDLPDSLQPLTLRNGVPVRQDPDFARDVGRLITGIEQTLTARPAPGLLRRWGQRNQTPGEMTLVKAVAAPERTAPEEKPSAAPPRSISTTESAPPAAGLRPGARPRRRRGALALATVVLLMVTLGLAFSQHIGGLGRVAAQKTPTATVPVTATTPQVTYPFTSAAPSCDAATHYAPWTATLLSLHTCTDPTRLLLTTDHAAGEINNSVMWTSSVANVLPARYLVSIKVSDIGPSGTNASAHFSIASHGIMYEYRLSANGLYFLERTQLAHTESMVSGKAFSAGATSTLDFAVTSVSITGQFNGEASIDPDPVAPLADETTITFGLTGDLQTDAHASFSDFTIINET